MKASMGRDWRPEDLGELARLVAAVFGSTKPDERIRSFLVEAEASPVEEGWLEELKLVAGDALHDGSDLWPPAGGDRVLNLRKDRWRSALAEERIFPLFFVGAAAYEAYLQRPLEELWVTSGEEEGMLFADESAKPRMVFVGDADLCLQGPFLSVIGGKFLKDWQSYLPSSLRQPEITPEQLLVKADEGCHWSGFSLGDLTPLHVAIDAARVPGEAQVLALLDRNCIHQSLLFLASQARRRPEDGRFTAIFSFQDDRVELRLADLPPGDMTGAVRQLVDWVRLCYGMREKVDADRLGHLRGLIARRMPHEGDPFKGLLAKVGELEAQRQQSWDVFVQRKLDEFFANENRFEEKIETALQKHQGAADELSRSLSESVKGTIAVVLGSLLTSLFDTDLETSILRTGAALYGVYILLIPFGGGLILASRRFEGAEQGFAAIRERFAAILGEKKVAAMVQLPLARAKRDFVWTKRLSIACYIALLILLAAVVWGF